MDRKGTSQEIQGGGGGEGFQDPRHIGRETDEKKKAILERIRSHSGKAIFKEDLFDFEGNNDARIWRESLDAHVFATMDTGGEGSEQQESHLLANCPAGSSSDHAKRDFATVVKKAATENVLPMRKEIPNLPKTAQELVSMWLHGSKEKGFRPVKLYDRGETRSAIIKHYSDRQWTSSGQKRAFYRFKRIVKEIAANNDELKDIFATDKKHWEVAIARFESKWSKDGKCRPLSYVEKEV